MKFITLNVNLQAVTSMYSKSANFSRPGRFVLPADSALPPAGKTADDHDREGQVGGEQGLRDPGQETRRRNVR